MEEMLLLISQSEKIRRKTYKLSHHYKWRRKNSIQYVDNSLYFIFYFILLYLLKLQRNEEESLNSVLASITFYIESTQKKLYSLSKHHKRSRRSFRKLLKDFETLITVYLSINLTKDAGNNKALLEESITELSAYTTKFYNNINYTKPSEPENKVVEEKNVADESTLGILSENQVAISTPSEKNLKETPKEDTFSVPNSENIKATLPLEIIPIEKKVVISNNITNIIKTQFTGVEIVVPISGSEEITGEVIFNISGIVSLKSKNRIFFLNEKTVKFFY